MEVTERRRPIRGIAPDRAVRAQGPAAALRGAAEAALPAARADRRAVGPGPIATAASKAATLKQTRQATAAPRRAVDRRWAEPAAREAPEQAAAREPAEDPHVRLARNSVVGSVRTPVRRLDARYRAVPVAPLQQTESQRARARAAISIARRGTRKPAVVASGTARAARRTREVRPTPAARQRVAYPTPEVLPRAVLRTPEALRRVALRRVALRRVVRRPRAVRPGQGARPSATRRNAPRATFLSRSAARPAISAVVVYWWAPADRRPEPRAKPMSLQRIGFLGRMPWIACQASIRLS
jgi:hypothetical protein